jgi:arylsulfatase A-like enzyme
MKNRISRRIFLKQTTLNLAALSLSPLLLTHRSSAGGKKRPNVLFIIVDDLRPELNCYGANHIQSPHIDNLARSGLLFTNAFVQQADCAASRASILSGCRPNKTGVKNTYSQYFINEFLKKYPTIPGYFYRNGYFVRTLGKIHDGFDERLSVPHFIPNAKSHYILSLNIEDEKAASESSTPNNQPFEAADAMDGIYRDGEVTEEVLKTLKQVTKSANQPWFLAIGFYKPHLPFVAPKKYWDIYDQQQIALALNKDHPAGSPLYATNHTELMQYAGPNTRDGKLIPDKRARELRHGYFACISFIDAQVGRILREINRLSQRDNTIIVFCSDHGWHLGEHGMWGKGTNFDQATKSPLIISIPWLKTKRRTCTALVEHVDLFATLAELANLAIPPHLEGSSFMPLLMDPDKVWKKAVFSQVARGDDLVGYTIRTTRYRYMEWLAGKDNSDLSMAAYELYDHQTDPNETVNIANFPANKILVQRFSRQIQVGWKKALPQGVMNASS